MEECLNISFDEQFFDGISDNPIHQAMFLPLPSIKLAHMSCTEENLHLAKIGLLEKICITDTEQKKFAYLQIAANNFLKSNGLITLPLLHLTPRMLLPFEKPPITANSNNFMVDCLQPKLQKSEQAQSKKSKKKKKSDVDLRNTSRLPSPQDPMQKQQGVSVVSSSVYPNIQSVLESMSPECKNFVGHICNLYEQELVNIRDHYENIIQSLNLRLYIAQEDIEQMKSIVNKSPSHSSRILQLIENKVNT